MLMQAASDPSIGPVKILWTKLLFDIPQHDGCTVLSLASCHQEYRQGEPSSSVVHLPLVVCLWYCCVYSYKNQQIFCQVPEVL